ncbi:MAG: autotransporter outer membrane beta-barrel domain-containing protein [Methylococcaceae bacterium]|nr:autotransporter outer membrane beta-barrel domain-containing protein [Methylococcaceae bacterium]
MIKKILLTVGLLLNVIVVSAGSLSISGSNGNFTTNTNNIVPAGNNLLGLTITFLDNGSGTNTGSVFNTSAGRFSVETTDYDIVSVANNQGGQSISIVNGNTVIQAGAVVTDANGNLSITNSSSGGVFLAGSLVAPGTVNIVSGGTISVTDTSTGDSILSSAGGITLNRGGDISLVPGGETLTINSLAGGPVVPFGTLTLFDVVDVAQDIAQVEQLQTQSENTIRVSSGVVANHMSNMLSNAFGFDMNATATDLKMGASSDSSSQYAPDAFWGKHVYSNLTEAGDNLGYDTDLYQFIGGVDKRLGDFIVGSALSYVYGETHRRGNNDSTHTIGITPYASYKINSFLFVSGLAGYNYTSVNGTEGKKDADVHNYNGELTLSAFKAFDAFLVKGRGGLRYTHSFTSLEGTVDGSYDQLTWIGDIEFGYNINSKIHLFTGVLYEYIDKEATVGSNILAKNDVTHDGVAYFRAGAKYRVNERLSFGLDASSDLNDEDNDIMSFGASVRLEL